MSEMYGKPPMDVFNFCACMGPVYGEPLCPCEMRRAGLPMSPEHVKANEDAKHRLDALFEPGGIFHQSGEPK